MATPPDSIVPFLAQLAANPAWQRELEALDLSTPAPFAEWVEGKGFALSLEELKAALQAGADHQELDETALEEVSGGNAIVRQILKDLNNAG